MTRTVIVPPEFASSRDERDVPLQSTESTPEAAFVFSGQSTETSSAFNFRTPSISVSPTPEPEHREYTFSPIPGPRPLPPSREQTSDEIRHGLAQLHVDASGALSNLQSLSSALNGVPLAQAEPTPRSSLTAPAGHAGRGGRSGQTTPHRRPSSVLAYDVANEEYPNDPFNSAEFQSALLDAKAVAQKLADVLSSSTLHQEEESAVHRLYNDSLTLANFRPSETRTVGFVGGTGVGKSSVLNSLLDEMDLVKSGSSGWACTCAATEFHYHESELLNIEVQLYDKDELLQQQMQYLGFYREFYSAEKLSAKDQEEMGKSAQLAEDTFKALFQSRLPSRHILLHEPTSDVERIFKNLIEELRPSEAETTMKGLTKQECGARLLELSPTVASTAAAATQAVAWPYIEKIKVYLNAQILKRGLILADLPGLRDMNSARKRITELYIRNCDEVFAVCEAGRAIVDENVADIFLLAEHLSNISIICTMSDLDDIEAYQNNIEEWEEEMLELEYEQSGLHDVEQQKQKLAADILQEKNRRDVCKFQLQTFLVESRNSDLRDELPGKYRADHSNENTKVFCVSNVLYRKKRHANIQTALPYLRLSGIISLRQHCVSIVSTNQHREASAFINTEVPKLLSAVHLWVQSGLDTLDGERRAAVTRVLHDIELQLRTGAAGCLSGQEPHKSHLTIGLDTNAVGARDWNGEANSLMVEDLRRPWNTLQCSVQEQQQQVSRSLNQQAEAVIHQLSKLQALTEVSSSKEAIALTSIVDAEIARSLSDDNTALVVLRGAFDLERDTLRYEVERLYEAAHAKLRQLRVNGLSSMRTSYIGLAMEPSYNTCRRDGGSGVDRRRKNIIERAFGDEELFEGIMQKLLTQFRAIARATQDDVTAAVRRYLEKVHATMDLVRDENTAIESQRDLVFHRRVSEAMKSAQQTMRSVASRISNLGSQ
ncbi:hypothetical protein PWT90_02340 [Aphanocladium album]|nr:hypothetical protein PWT90_02340 [Aphanocladium album]